MIKYIFFDVAGTLLGKPSLYVNIQNVLAEYGHVISIEEIKNKHKLLSEVIHFPDRTDEVFYKKFNAELLYLLGIPPSESILQNIFKSCTYLPWVAYEDTKFLGEWKLPIGIISNFNTTLKEKLTHFFGPIFKDVFVSEELGVAKPSIEFYRRALEKIPYQANEVLYIGDSIKLDLQPAQDIGFKVLIIDRGNFYSSLKERIGNLAEVQNYI
jgi:putative hydrolase of the HAD superfamily